MKRILEIVIGLSLIIGFISCDKIIKIVCVEPSGSRKEFIDSLNNSNQGILIAKEVPCYPGYFQIDLKTIVDSTRVSNLDTLVRNHQYTEVLIYDKNKKLIRGETGSM